LLDQTLYAFLASNVLVLAANGRPFWSDLLIVFKADWAGKLIEILLGVKFRENLEAYRGKFLVNCLLHIAIK